MGNDQIITAKQTPIARSSLNMLWWIDVFNTLSNNIQTPYSIITKIIIDKVKAKANSFK